MSSRWAVAVLCLLTGVLLRPVLTLADEAPSRILFLHLRIEQDGSVRVLGSRVASGKLKTPGQARGTLKLELQGADNTALWNGAVEDPRVRHFEIEHPSGSGKLERRAHTVPEAEFTVRVPLHGAAAKLLVFEDEPPHGNGVRQQRRKVLLTHPLPPGAQGP
jgi:hypothetical protein